MISDNVIKKCDWKMKTELLKLTIYSWQVSPTKENIQFFSPIFKPYTHRDIHARTHTHTHTYIPKKK